MTTSRQNLIILKIDITSVRENPSHFQAISLEKLDDKLPGLHISKIF